MNRQQKIKRWGSQNIKMPNQQIMTYAAAGVLALIADNIIFVLFLYVLAAPLEISVPAGLISGLVASFALNKQWTFKRDSRHKHSGNMQFILYICLFIFNNAFTYLFIKFVLIFGVAPVISKILATVCITLWNYLLYKKVIFR